MCDEGRYKLDKFKAWKELALPGRLLDIVVKLDSFLTTMVSVPLL